MSQNNIFYFLSVKLHQRPEHMPTFDLFRRSALCLAATSAFMPGLSFAAPPEFKFPSIDGGDIDLPGWRSGPVLVVSTASLCGYVDQFNGLQELHDRYAGQGTNVLAVPSDDFSQEQNLAEAVKSFCATTFDLTLPMTDILHVGGAEAQPFYVWLATKGFVPQWNFNKVLLGPVGEVVATWGGATEPMSRDLTARIEALLP